ncbi:ABC transporter substrate-binding protein [Roseomonas sp. USHLN139]|uniref:ABC transporter substrate-binding protein n=1 Tax=Roseomonas sp. USHLN139 TaxID=3081298 RepID=UPI003B0262CA
MLRRRTVLNSAIAALATPVLAPAISRAQGRSVLKFIPQSDLALLDPVQTTGLVTRNHGAMVFDTLYGLDAGFVPQPQMAAGHRVEDDGRTWLITLRDGLTFHDGTPVLARDVAASIDRWSRIDALGQTLRARADEIVAASDTVLRIRLKQPFPQLPFALGKASATCFIMPERLARTDVATQVSEIVGSGPFRFLPGERMAGQRAVYEKFARYVPRAEPPSFMAGGKVVKVDRVEWHTIPDASTAAAALQSGEMDWWEQPIPDLLPVLKRNRNIAVEVKDKGGYLGMIRFNQLHPPFDNPAIRRAFLAGINQADYMIATMGSDTSLWKDRVGFFTPGSPLANEAGLEALTAPRSLDRVKQALAEAGYKGEKVVFIVPSDLPALNAMSEITADLFRRVGINLDYQALDWGTVLPRLSSRNAPDKGGWSVWCNYLPGIVAVNPAGNSFMRGIGQRGPVGWPSSERLEALRDSFLEATDPAEQRRIAAEMQRQAFQDLPYIPTGFYYQPTAYRTSLRNIVEGFPMFWGVEKG